MKQLGFILLGLLAFSPTYGQVVPTPQGTAAMVCANNTVVPTPSNGKFFYVQCDANGKLITSGSGTATPSGPAGGDLSGTYPNPTVSKTGGVAFGAAATASIPLSVTLGGTGYTGGALSSYTPTITSSGGTFGATTSGGNYFVLGKIVFLDFYVGITTVGTATGYPIATLPVGTASIGAVLTCREVNNTGITATAYITNGTGSASISSYNNSATLLTNGNLIICSGFYIQS